MDAVELKQKKKGGKDKSALSKTGDSTGLLSHVNENVNMFSQLSAMFLAQKAEQSQDVKKFLEKTEDKQIFTQHSYDSEIQQCLNQMNKKSQITKLKALNSLKEILQKQPEEFFDQFILTWTYIYKQFVNSEFERKVFEESNHVLMIIIQKNRKCLQSQFKELFPYWFLQMNDPSPDIAAIANQAFDKMFPKEKQGQAFSVCMEKYLLNLNYYLSISQKQIQSENNNLSDHESLEIYDRLLVSSLNSITRAIELNKDSKDPSLFIQSLEQQIFQAKRNPLIDLLSKKRTKVRAAVIDAMYTLLNTISDEVFDQSIETIAKNIMPLIDEKERLIQISLWRGCLLTILDKAPPLIIAKCDLKMIEIKSLEVLKKAASGIGRQFYSNIIIFLSKLPMAAFTALTNKDSLPQANTKFNVEEYIKERFTFIKKFFESILAGFAHDEIKFFGDFLVQSYFECIYFIVLKRFAVVLEREEVKPLKNIQKQARNLIRDLVCNAVNLFLEDHVPDNIMSPFKQLPNSLGQLLNNFSHEQFGTAGADLFDELIYEFASIFNNTAKKDTTKFNNYLLILQSAASVVTKQSIIFDKLDNVVQKMHEELLNDLKGELKPLMNDSHIEKMLPICTQYKQYANIFNFSALKQTKKQEDNSIEVAVEQSTSHGIFQNLISQQTVAALETISFSVQSIIQNIKTITNPTSLEKFTTFISQIYSSWSESLTESHPQYSAFQQILKDIQNHIRMLNQVDPKALLHLQFILHFTLPETNPSYFSQFCTQFNKIKSTDDVLIIRNISQLESATAQKNRVNITARLQNNQEYQDLAFGILSHIFAKMDRYLGVSLPLLVIIFKYYLNKENKIKLVEQIKQSINKKRESIFSGEIQEKNVNRVIDELELYYLFCIQIYKDLPKVIGDESYNHLEFFTDFFKFIFFCFEKKLKSRISQAFKLFKYLINDKQAVSSIVQNISEIFANELTAIFIDMKSDKFEVLLKVIIETFSFLKNNKKKDEILSLTSVILQPKYFANIIFEQRNWRLLEALFESITVSIDFNAFIKNIFVSKTGFWLISNLISSQQVFAILNSIKLKKYFKDLAYNFIKPLIHNTIEEDFEIVVDFLNDMMKSAIDKSLVFGNALQACLKQIMVDGIESHKQLRIFNDIVKVKLDNLFSLENIDLMMREGILVKNLLPLFKEQLENDSGNIEDILRKKVSEVCRMNASELTDQNKLSCLISLDILMASFQEDFYTTEGQQIQLTDFMLVNFEKFNAYNSYQNYYTSVFFAFINIVLEKIGIEPFSNNLVGIENHFRRSIEYNAKPRKQSSNALISILIFLRKIINIIEGGFSTDFKEFAIQNIMDTCLIKLGEFEFNQTHQKNNVDTTLMIDESNDIVIIEFAETISRFVTILNEYFDENLAYELLNCRYPSIQKSCFLLLRQFYQAFSPKMDLALKCQKTDDDFEDQLLQSINDQKMNVENLLKYLDVTNIILTEEEKQKHLTQLKKQQGLETEQEGLKQEEQKTDKQQIAVQNDESTEPNNFINPFEQKEGQNDDTNEEEDIENEDIIDPSTYGHLLTWISFINKLNTPENNEDHELVKKALKLYLDENKFYHKNFLTVLFQWIEFLEIPETQQKDMLTIEEVQNVNPEWSDFLSKESLFQLLVQSLYVFSSKFPFYLRNWLENTAEKRFIKVAENLIKCFISNALYLKEVETIELSQIEWQSEEFNIYVMKKTREINAVYMKENQKLEINLKIPLEYPIKHILTEVKRGMKVNQQKTNKWMLMMKSLLFNQNNTIKNALLMWKDNLDKELEGLEECAICYYVINSTSGELPKLPCKTCKKKFHSSCIHKWFKSSNKSECPLCKSQFL